MYTYEWYAAMSSAPEDEIPEITWKREIQNLAISLTEHCISEMKHPRKLNFFQNALLQSLD